MFLPFLHQENKMLGPLTHIKVTQFDITSKNNTFNIINGMEANINYSYLFYHYHIQTWK